MRQLSKNKSTIKAHNYVRTENILDTDGYATGEKKIVYGKLYSFKANISGAKGSSQSEIFGSDIQYDKTFTLTTSELKQLKINEHTVFFVDKQSEYKDGQPLYNYRVKKIAEGLNDVVVAIEKV